MLSPFDLNLRHLRAIPEIVARGSVAAAADAASLSQPALTQGLAKIEARLGVPLFDRQPDGMAATPAGLSFAERVTAALARLAEGARGGGRAPRGFARPHRLMTSSQLRAFLAVADAGGFAGAARAARGSQPAIHRAVRDLEQLIGQTLVERRGRGVVLTDVGRSLARAVRLAGAELAAAIAAAAPDAGLDARLVIGAMPMCRARLLPAAIAGLLRDGPDVSIDIIEGSWRELVEPLRDGAIDLMVGALREAPEPPDLTQAPLLVDRLAVVCRADHPLARQAAPDLAALAGFPWIVGNAGSPLRGHWEALFAGHDAPVAPVECGSVMTIRGILTASDCLTLLSPDQVTMEVEAGLLALIPPPGRPLVRTIGVTSRAGWRPTALQDRFTAALRAAAATQEVA